MMYLAFGGNPASDRDSDVGWAEMAPLVGYWVRPMPAAGHEVVTDVAGQG